MGYQQARVEVRQTVWAECETEGEAVSNRDLVASTVSELPPSLQFLQGVTELPVANSTVGVAPSTLYGEMRVCTEWGRGLKGKKRFGNDDFQIVNDQIVRCPAGHQMYRKMSQKQPNGDLKMQYGLNPKICQSCAVRKRCLAPNSKGSGGRRVTVIRPVISDPTSGLAAIEVSQSSALVRSVKQWVGGQPKQPAQPILWCDIAATELRRRWHQRLAMFEVKISEIPAPLAAAQSGGVKLFSRRQREHHRLSWWERNERNARTRDQEQWRVVMPAAAKILLEGLEHLSKRSFVGTG